MHDRSSTRIVELRRLYDSAERDVEFSAVLASAEARDDLVLAELIEADGRLRISRGQPVHISRYFAAVPDLAERADPLDAAIDVALRQLSGGARSRPAAIDQLIAQYPELEEPIREAAALSAAVWSTTGLKSEFAPLPSKPLPCEFGPLMSDGQQRYQLQELLGQGAFGQVYLANDRQLSEEGHPAKVAIKVLVARNRSPWDRQRMIEEATKVRRISHPNVVQVIDRGVSEDDEDFIVYELVDGGDMSDLLARVGRVPVREAAQLVRQIALGVHAAHSAGVIHCDLKPGNIMLTKSGVPKVGDFGIAVRLTDGSKAATNPDTPEVSAGPVGNLAFVSPEQYRGEEGARSIHSDIYSLGGILFACLTGELPNGSTVEEIAATHHPQQGRTQPPDARTPRPEVDGDLQAICARALAPKPQDRYASAAAMAEDLDHWLKREPIAWAQPSRLHVLRLWVIRKPALAVSLAIIVCLIIAASVIAFRLNAKANAKAIEAAENRVKFELEEQFRKRGENAATAFRNAFGKSNADYRFSTEALTYIWVFEYLFGPAVYASPDDQMRLWKSRIQQMREFIAASTRESGPDHLETLLWESALAFWLVCDGDYLEAEPLLNRNIAAWESRLSPDDSWLGNMRGIRLCARVNRLKSERGFDTAALQELEQQLIAASQSAAKLHEGTPIHFLMLKSRLALYGSELLNDPSKHEALSAELKTLLDQTKFKLESPKKK